MISQRKIQANRANAQASTGPKTSHGRVRSAKNAFVHGLSLSVLSDQALCEQVQALASQIAGPHASPHIKMLALRVAEAQIDVCRVRAARHHLLFQQLGNPHYGARANERERMRLIRSLLRQKAEDLIAALAKLAMKTPAQGPQKLATILLQEDKKLLSFDRYERRALSRRRFAIRALDMAQRQRHSR